MGNFSEADKPLFKAQLSALEQVVDKIPAAVIIHCLQPFTVAYISPWAIRNLGVKPEEVMHLTEKEYHEKYFNPEDAKDYVPKITGLLNRGDEQEMVTYFQQVRTVEREGWSWYLSSSKIFFKDKGGVPSHIITISCPVDPIYHISAKVNRLLEENTFLRQNQALFAELTKREKEILSMTALGQSSQEISASLNIAETTVETHRKNIRKKIKAQNNYDIILFAQAFDLI